jgi:hypothetical protein
MSLLRKIELLEKTVKQVGKPRRATKKDIDSFARRAQSLIKKYGGRIVSVRKFDEGSYDIGFEIEKKTMGARKRAAKALAIRVMKELGGKRAKYSLYKDLGLGELARSIYVTPEHVEAFYSSIGDWYDNLLVGRIVGS